MGSKDGGGPITIGYHYFMSMHMVICQGPVDKIRAILSTDDHFIHSADIIKQDDPLSIDIMKPDLFGGAKKEGGLQGRALVLFGTDTQAVSSTLQDLMGGKLNHTKKEGGSNGRVSFNYDTKIMALTNLTVAAPPSDTDFDPKYTPAFRGVTSVVWDNMLYGSNLSRPKGWKFRVERVPYIGLPNASIGQNIKNVIGTLAANSSSGVKLKKLTTGDGVGNPNLDWLRDFGFNGYKIKVALGGDGVWWTGKKVYAFFLYNSSGVHEGTYFYSDFNLNGVTNVGKVVKPANAPHGYYKDGVPTGSTTGSRSIRLVTGLSDQDDTELTNAILNGLLATEGTVLYDSSTSHSTVIDSAKDQDITQAANPAYILLECLTNPVWGLGFDVTIPAARPIPAGSGGEFIDLNSFTDAAAVLATEKFGLCAIWQNESSVEDFMSGILAVINAVVFLEPTSGRFRLKLLRAEDGTAATGENSSFIANEDNVLEVRNFARSGVSELVNQLSVVWTDPVMGGPKSLTLSNSAVRELQGHTVAVTKTYSAITDDTLAMTVATRDLGLFSQSLAGVDLVLNRSAAHLTIGSVIDWSWSDYGIKNMSLRVSSISFGLVGDGRITVKCVENVYRINKTVYGDAAPVEVAAPANIGAVYPEVARVISLSYLDLFMLRHRFDIGNIPALLETDETSGVVAVFARAPNRYSNQFQAQVSNTVDGVFSNSGSLSFTPYAKGSTSINKNQTLISLTDQTDLHELIPSSIGDYYQYSTPNASSYLICCEGNSFEVMELRSLAKDYSFVKVTRGVANTTPKQFYVGAEFWFYSQNLNKCTLQIEYPEYASVFIKTMTECNRETYTDGPGKRIAIPFSTTVKSWALPYPVANLTAQVSSGDVSINWEHRDAALLQDKLVGQVGSMERTPGIFYAIEIRSAVGELLEHDHRWIGKPSPCHYVYHPQVGHEIVYVGVKAIEGDLQSEWNVVGVDITGLGNPPEVTPIFPEITPIIFQQSLHVNLNLSLVNSTLGTTGLREVMGNDLQLRITIQVKDMFLSRNEKAQLFKRYRIEVLHPDDGTVLGTHYSSAIDSLYLYSADLNQTDHGTVSNVVTFRVFVEDMLGNDSQGSIIIGKTTAAGTAEELYTGVRYATIADAVAANLPSGTLVYLTTTGELDVVN